MAAVLVAVASVALAPVRAAACSIMLLPMATALPPAGATLGPRPLLLALPGQGNLVPLSDDLVGEPIALVRDEALDGVLLDGQGLEGWRPRDPLAAGTYLWGGVSGGPVTLHVDPTLAPAAPPARGTSLHVTLTEPAGQESCGTIDSCDDIDFTRLVVTLAAPAPDADPASRYLLEVTSRKSGASRRALVTPDATAADGSQSISLWDRWAGLPSLKSARTCVTLTPVADDGTLGAKVDLGCVDPDGDDPRVSDDRGCAVAGSSDTLPLVLAVLALRRRARHPPAC